MFTTKSPLIQAVIADTLTATDLYLQAVAALAAVNALSATVLGHVAYTATHPQEVPK